MHVYNILDVVRATGRTWKMGVSCTSHNPGWQLLPSSLEMSLTQSSLEPPQGNPLKLLPVIVADGWNSRMPLCASPSFFTFRGSPAKSDFLCPPPHPPTPFLRNLSVSKIRWLAFIPYQAHSLQQYSLTHSQPHLYCHLTYPAGCCHIGILHRALEKASKLCFSKDLYKDKRPYYWGHSP